MLLTGQQPPTPLLAGPGLQTHTHTHTAGHTDAQQPRPQSPPSELTLLLQRRGRGLALPHRQETDTILGQGGQGPEGGTQGHVFPKSCVLMHRGGGGSCPVTGVTQQQTGVATAGLQLPLAHGAAGVRDQPGVGRGVLQLPAVTRVPERTTEEQRLSRNDQEKGGGGWGSAHSPPLEDGLTCWAWSSAGTPSGTLD